MIEERNIIIGDRLITYEIHYKNIKHCYLRVQQGKTVISMSKGHDVKIAEDLIRKNQELIVKQIDSFADRARYENNGYVSLFGKKYQLIVRDLHMKKWAVHDQKIYIYGQNVEAIATAFLKEQLYNYIEMKIKAYLVHDFDLHFPEIQIRQMKSRWGACFYQKNRICFNFSLVFLDKELIDYVIVHELCHFLQPNHSKAFYQEIKKRLPQYQLAERKLKEISI